MNIVERNRQLDVKFGIVDEIQNTSIMEYVPSTVLEKSEVVPVPDEVDNKLKDGLFNGKEKLEKMYTTLEKVLESHSEAAISFSKASDVEAVSALAKTMLELRKEVRETYKDVYGKSDDAKGKQTNNQQNNIIFSGDTRQLIDALSSMKK